MRRSRGFTLIEIVLAVFILMLLMLLAVPSLNGVLADRRLRRSLDGFNKLVHQAQERSVTERRSYLIVWRKDSVLLRPEAFVKGEQSNATAEFHLDRGETLFGRQAHVNRQLFSSKARLVHGSPITPR